MSLREWLIAIGTLVILGIVIDGIRRMRRARKDAMAISSGMGADDLEEGPLEAEYNPELPNGGARTVDGVPRPEREPGRSRFANPEPKPTRPVISARDAASQEQPLPQQGPDRPMPEEASLETEQAPDSGWSALDDEPLEDDEVLGSARPATGQAERPAPDTAREPRGEQPRAETPAEPRTRPSEKVPPVVTSEVEEDTARRERSASTRRQPLAGANRPEAQEVIVINVLSRPDKAFSGPALKKLFEACGLELGDMDIYHRHEEADTTSPVQFSVASAVEPGTFRPEDIPAMSTPGISFFMSMPGPGNPLQAFDFMLETAQCVVRNLGGELKDERRSVMTPQTIEHCRQRVREFERKRRSQRV